MKSYVLAALGIGLGIGSIFSNDNRGAILAAGCLIAAGLYRIAERD